MAAATLACFTLALVLAVAPASAVVFSNPTTIQTTDPVDCFSPTLPGSPYPSNIVVSGLTGTVSDVNVTLNGLTNDWGGDLEVMLVGPGGGSQNLVLLSDAGANTLSGTVNLTLDDAAASLVPQNSSITTGSRKPTDYAELATDAFPAPAPAIANRPATAGSATLASVFNGIAPNGTWSLYVVTDACDDPAERLQGGWSLDITTAVGAATTTTVNSSLNPSNTGQNVTFTATVSSGGPVTTGTVTFTEGATTLAANVPLNGVGQAGFSKSNFAEGNHIVTATYNGTPSFNTSNGSVNQRVDNVTVVTGNNYCNTGPITINALPTATATPYPSNIFVSGASSSITKVTATLKNVTHQFPDDVDVLLVGPAGQNLVLVSDAGNPGGPGFGANNVTAVFDDAAAGQLAQNSPWGAPGSTVNSKPVDYDPAAQVDTFAAPAPAPSAATALSTFNGSNPNGTWRLYVMSDGAPDTGTIAGGWCVTVTAIGPSLPAVVRTSTTWLLRDTLTSGPETINFTYGAKPLVPLMGDWNGDGTETAGTFEGGVFKLRNANAAGGADITFTFGNPRGFPIGGDFNGDGTDDVAVYRDGTWEVRFSTGATLSAFTFGSGAWPATVPVSGDWDGNGTDGIGTYTYATASWALRNTATTGAADVGGGPFVFGTPNSSYPVAGDWDADIDDTVGVKTGTTWSLRNSNSAGGADTTITYGLANDLPLTWRKP